MTKPKAQKKLPLRTCAVCGLKQSKHQLQRIVQTDGGLVVDASGKKNGRGAYLCDNKDCWERAVKTNILEKALRTTLTSVDRQHLLQAMP